MVTLPLLLASALISAPGGDKTLGFALCLCEKSSRLWRLTIRLYLEQALHTNEAGFTHR